jgi:hypothetical protein
MTWLVAVALKPFVQAIGLATVYVVGQAILRRIPHGILRDTLSVRLW